MKRFVIFVIFVISLAGTAAAYNFAQPTAPKTAEELYKEKTEKEKEDVRDRQVPNLRQ